MYYLPRFNSDIFIILELIENNDLEGVRNYLKEYGNKDINCSFNIRGYPDNWYTTPINEAIKNNKFEIADILLDNGANINTICSQILDVNELHGYKMVFKFDDKINKENLKYLLEHNYRIGNKYRALENILNSDKRDTLLEVFMKFCFTDIKSMDECYKKYNNYVNDKHISFLLNYEINFYISSNMDNNNANSNNLLKHKLLKLIDKRESYLNYKKYLEENKKC